MIIADFSPFVLQILAQNNINSVTQKRASFYNSSKNAIAQCHNENSEISNQRFQPRNAESRATFLSKCAAKIDLCTGRRSKRCSVSLILCLCSSSGISEGIPGEPQSQGLKTIPCWLSKRHATPFYELFISPPSQPAPTSCSLAWHSRTRMTEPEEKKEESVFQQHYGKVIVWGLTLGETQRAWTCQNLSTTSGSRTCERPEQQRQFVTKLRRHSLGGVKSNVTFFIYL